MFNLKGYSTQDTIAAIATFPARSGLGVIKISGKKALDMVHKIFRPAKPKDIRKVKTYTLHYGYIVENSKFENQKSKQKTIDEVLVSVMRGPRSYTREDMVEVSSHGGPYVLERILKLILKQGARLAQSGEFTYRAFINGRIDLTQAQSVAAITEAGCEQALVQALAQLEGSLSREINVLKESLKELYVWTQAHTDFPEDSLEPRPGFLRQGLKQLVSKVGALIVEARAGRVLKEGFRCVICGRTNTGKSTLFNRLLREERVIVSHIPGTTRDVLDETINIRGVPLRIYDTAGILKARDVIEEKAMEKTRRAFDNADLTLVLIDGSRQLCRHDRQLLKKARDNNSIVVINKSDLAQKISDKEIRLLGRPVVRISALKNRSLTMLEGAILRCVRGSVVTRPDAVFLSRYQEETLVKISDRLNQSLEYLGSGQGIDMVDLVLAECLEGMGKLSGETASSEILEEIFSKFCIGK
jgi:tRNA modification GTPase